MIFKESTGFESTIVTTPEEVHSLTLLTGFEYRAFSLLWRGSRDGFETSTFHSRCDGKPNTLTLIKNSLGYVFGGYTAVPWSSPSNATEFSDPTAFLFSLKNPSNNPLKLKVVEPEFAVMHFSHYGPIFGGYNHSRDLSFYNYEDPKNSMKFKSYESPDGKKGVEGAKYVLEELQIDIKRLKSKFSK